MSPQQQHDRDVDAIESEALRRAAQRMAKRVAKRLSDGEARTPGLGEAKPYEHGDADTRREWTGQPYAEDGGKALRRRVFGRR